MKRRLRQYLICYLLSFFVIGAYVWYQLATKELSFVDEWSHILSEAFFVNVVLFSSLWVFSFISHDGFFDIFKYSFKRFGARMFRKNPKFSNVPKTFYEYRTIKHEEEAPYVHYLAWVALSWLVLLLLFFVFICTGIGCKHGWNFGTIWS